LTWRSRISSLSSLIVPVPIYSQASARTSWISLPSLLPRRAAIRFAVRRFRLHFCLAMAPPTGRQN
jgi:hypothetical protein